MPQATKPDDLILTVEAAAPILRSKFGAGWTRSTVRKKIENNEPFQWIERVHYFTSKGRLKSLNVDAISRSLLR